MLHFVPYYQLLTPTLTLSLSKLLVKMLSPLCQSEYSVCASFTFVRDILCIENHNYVIASFDNVSLFTCIPVDENYNRIPSKTFNNSEMSCGYTKKLFKRIFDICCKGNTFLFNGNLYKQTDGHRHVWANVFHQHSRKFS